MENFISACPEALSTAIAPLASHLHLHSLPLHTHHVFGAALFYQFIYLVISPILSNLFLRERYNSFPKRTQINWDVHVVSLVQSTFICAIALWGMLYDEERAPGWEESQDAKFYRVFGYSVTGGAVQGYATGYFLWDLCICVWHFKIMGFGFLAHAISALAVFSLGFVSLPGLWRKVGREFFELMVFTETVRKLLRLHLHSLRTLFAFPQHPLVLRQTRTHRRKNPTHQRPLPNRDLLLLPSSMGHLQLGSRLQRHLFRLCPPPSFRTRYPRWGCCDGKVS